MTLIARWRDLAVTERTARCRSLAMGARLLAGTGADALVATLHRAETDPAALADCDNELALAPTTQHVHRHVVGGAVTSVAEQIGGSVAVFVDARALSEPARDRSRDRRDN